MTSLRSGHALRGSNKATSYSQIWLKFLENETAFEESTDPVWSGKLTAHYTAINIPVTNCHASQYAWVWVQQSCDRKGWLCQCWDIALFMLWELSAISPWLHDVGKISINLLSAIHTALTAVSDVSGFVVGDVLVTVISTVTDSCDVSVVSNVTGDCCERCEMRPSWYHAAYSWNAAPPCWTKQP